MQVFISVEEPVSLTVEALGNRGEGVAACDGEKVYIPFTLPGEIVTGTRDRGRGTLLRVDHASPDRVEPVCPHFGICGGCALQHYHEPAYRDWKANQLRSAVIAAGLAVPAFKMNSYPVNGRRRTALTATKASGRVLLGYRQARSHGLADIAGCAVLTPRLQALLPVLRKAVIDCRTEATAFRIQLTEAANGVDCSIETEEGPREPPRNAIGAFEPCRFIRLTWNAKLVIQQSEPFVTMGAAQVPLPPAAFLQAIELCERDMAAFAVEALGARIKPKTAVCDLFSGLGAFTFPMAALYPVTALETNQETVKALETAARSTKGLRPIKAIRRDLFRNPLSKLELKPFGAAIIDPPYQGAEAQMRAMAASHIATVVSMSCNATTFTRDASILTAGGFKMTKLAAFDQFTFTPHVEIAALFVR